MTMASQESQPNSTPSKRVLRSTKRHESDANISQPPSNQSQDSLEIAVGNDLEDHTWLVDAKTIAKILSPKPRKTPLQADQVDQLEDYESFAIDNFIEALESIKLVLTEFPTSESERDHYPPFSTIAWRFATSLLVKAKGNIMTI